MGCSAHSVPSLSNTAMRSSGATKVAAPAVVTSATNLRIACFDAVSFQADSACACAGGALLRLRKMSAQAAIAGRMQGMRGAAATRPSSFAAMSLPFTPHAAGWGAAVKLSRYDGAKVVRQGCRNAIVERPRRLSGRAAVVVSESTELEH